MLPPHVNKVAMQNEILTALKAPPSTLHQASKWLEETQRRLNLCIKTRQDARPRTLVASVTQSLGAVAHYHRTIGNTWDSLYNKRQMRDPDITLDRVYNMLSEFLTEVKHSRGLQLSEEQGRIAQIATGANGTQMKPTAYDEYVNASKGKIQKGKGKAQMERGQPRIGDDHVQTIGSLMVAAWITTAQSIILVDILVDALSVDQQTTSHHSASAPSSPC